MGGNVLALPLGGQDTASTLEVLAMGGNVLAPPLGGQGTTSPTEVTAVLLKFLLLGSS